jgi:hypothetical protein
MFSRQGRSILWFRGLQHHTYSMVNGYQHCMLSSTSGQKSVTASAVNEAVYFESLTAQTVSQPRRKYLYFASIYSNGGSSRIHKSETCAWTEVVVASAESLKNLTPRSTFLLQKLEFPQLVKTSPAFMEPESSWPCSEEPATCPCPEPDQSSPCYPILFPIYFNILLPSTPRSS